MIGGRTRTSGQGRPKGSRNKATADIKALAQVHTAAAMKELARIATHSESDAARVSAIKELFDRGFGRPAQGVDLTGELNGRFEVTWLPPTG